MPTTIVSSAIPCLLGQRRRVKQLAVLACALAAAATAAHAQRSEIYYRLSDAAAGTTLTNAAGFQTATGPSLGATYSQFNGLPGTVSIRAQSSIGSAKVAATGSGAGYSGFVQSSWDDDVTFTGGPAGTRGTVTFNMSWDWTPSISVSANGYGHTQPYIDLFLTHAGPRDRASDQYGAIYQHISRACNATLQCTDDDSGISADGSAGSFSSPSQAIYPTPVVTWAGQVGTFEFVVEFGKTYNLMAAIGTSVDGGSSTTTLDATHSLTWRGISSVVNAQGQPVAYSVASASGFNYVTAVPEPQQLALLLLGVPMLAFAARRARRRCAGAASTPPTA